MILVDINEMYCKLIKECVIEKDIKAGDILKLTEKDYYVVIGIGYVNEYPRLVVQHYIGKPSLYIYNRKNIECVNFGNMHYYKKCGHIEGIVINDYRRVYEIVVNYVKIKLDARVGSVINVMELWRELILDVEPLVIYRTYKEGKDILNELIEGTNNLMEYIEVREDFTCYLEKNARLEKQLNEDKVRKSVLKLRMIGKLQC